jgi:dipeptidyl aminopeptidase/acylaminoacyl peptidase
MTKAGLALAALMVASASIVAQQGPPVFELALVDRAGTVVRVGKLPPGTFAPRLSPDGRRLTFDTYDGMIWTADLANIGAPRRFGAGRFPMWSADGSRILFSGSDGMRLYWQAADGSGSPELLTENARAPEFWSTTAQLVTYITLKSAGDYDIWAFSPVDRKMGALVAAPASAEMSSRFSPDGKWLAYQANDSGMFEVYVEPFPRTGVRTRVSSAGGERPVWSPDGRELFYDHDRTLFAASFQAGPEVRVGKPAALAVKGFIQSTGRRLWELTPDGKQFLVMFPTD